MARTYRHCRACGRRAESVEELSHTGLCIDCGPELMATNVRGLRTPGSPEYERWFRAAAEGLARAGARAATRNAA